MDCIQGSRLYHYYMKVHTEVTASCGSLKRWSIPKVSATWYAVRDYFTANMSNFISPGVSHWYHKIADEMFDLISNFIDRGMSVELPKIMRSGSSDFTIIRIHVYFIPWVFLHKFPQVGFVKYLNTCYFVSTKYVVNLSRATHTSRWSYIKTEGHPVTRVRILQARISLGFAFTYWF